MEGLLQSHCIDCYHIVTGYPGRDNRLLKAQIHFKYHISIVFQSAVSLGLRTTARFKCKLMYNFSRYIAEGFPSEGKNKDERKESGIQKKNVSSVKDVYMGTTEHS